MWWVYFGAKRMVRSAAVPAQGPVMRVKEFADEASAKVFVANCRKDGVPANDPVQLKQTASG